MKGTTMARLISTEEEFNAWDPEIDPDVDIKADIILDLKRRRLLDDFDATILLYRFGV
jgi:hypothetical protein